jgi:hypothetical protein
MTRRLQMSFSAVTKVLQRTGADLEKQGMLVIDNKVRTIRKDHKGNRVVRSSGLSSSEFYRRSESTWALSPPSKSVAGHSSVFVTFVIFKYCANGIGQQARLTSPLFRGPVPISGNQ